MRYIIALDEGTTSARALLYDTKNNGITQVARRTHTQYYPKPGWVEHDAEEIWANIKECLQEITQNVSPSEIYGIGITNQRETIVAWNKKTGKPVCKAIVWQCRRTADYCKELQESNVGKAIKLKTGLLIDAYFSATKIKWILENNKKAQKLLKEGNLKVGTIDSFLIYRLTNGKKHVTDVTNASRTMLFNIHELDWDPFLLETFNIPREILPDIVGCSEIVGETNILGSPVKIAGIAGDQQASLFGQGCIKAGDAKNTYGTGSFVLVNTGNKICHSKNLVTTVAYKIGNEVTYALEGSIFNSGSIIDWICKDLRLVSNADQLNRLALKAEDSGGVYIVPAFTGLGCPCWDMDARGLISGLTRGTKIYHLARAVFESIAYSVNDVLQLIEKDSGYTIKTLKADGGAMKNSFLMQFQSNISNKRVYCSQAESTSLGVIFLAGLSTGAFKSISEIQKLICSDKAYRPLLKQVELQTALAGWNRAVRQCLKK